jgi:diguanylate cyclase (GGDEF)-like protein/PAS domain S-box-containing protein
VKEPAKKHGNIPNKIILIGIVVAVFFWVFDAVVDTLIFKEGDFLKNLLAPGLIEVWMRLVIMVMIVGISFYAQHLIIGRKGVEEALRTAIVKAEDEMARTASIIAGIGDGVSIQDIDFRILYQNQVHKDIIGDHIGEYCFKAYERKDSVCEGCPVAMTFEDGDIHTEERRVDLDDRILYVEITASPLRDATGEIIRGIEVVRDITERKKMEEELKQLAVTDIMTGAYNRTKFDEIMGREMYRAKRFVEPLSIIIFDIDHFKKVNDRYGHITGDYVLKTLSVFIKEQIRQIDYLVRWGGEEFVIIAPETNLEGAQVLAERIRKGIESYRFDKVARVTLSFGVTEFKKDDDLDSILKRADDALYKAKLNGRNRVETSVPVVTAIL